MKRNKLALVMLAVALLLNGATAVDAKKKEKHREKKETVQKTQYQKLLDKPGKTTAEGGFVTLHKLNGKLYAELPVKYLGRDVLLSSTIAETGNSRIATLGYKNTDPLHIRFCRLDSSVVIKTVNSLTEGDKELATAIKRSYNEPFFKKYKIEAWGKDSASVVFEMTDIFMGDEALLKPLVDKFSILDVKSTHKPALCALGNIKSFDDNATVESYLTYDYSINFMTSEVAKSKITVKVNRTLLLLPEELMKPRIADTRIGVFLTQKQNITMKHDGIEDYALANRWRLEPSDMEAWKAGKLVEPKKPILWYIDDAFPEDWKQPLKKSVTIWNKAFEKIGFKNVMQAVDFPKDDPNFDPDNLKYSCIRYVPISVENAMGPSWVDPRTGEIINATVLVYNDVIKLINNWRFVQTAQLDPDVRCKKMPKRIVYESLAYVFAHEIGHTLGLMHNMSASSVFPVDSLRSASFTQKYGTTPSIMDYARFNYVAQPGDKGVRLSPPDMGVYDEYAIKWLYSPIPGNLSVEEEAKVLEKWIDEKAGNPLYRYGRQQVYSRYDPSALEEDLGDDAVKAGEYGIKNLKYILKNLNNWIDDDESTAHRQELYEAICSQYLRYLNNALINVGGIYLTEIKDGTPEKRWKPVDRKKQHEVLMWVIEQIKNSDWLDDKNLTQNFPLALNKSLTMKGNIGRKIFGLDNKVLLCSHISNDPYTQREYYDDLFNAIWQNTEGKNRLTAGDKLLQRLSLQEMSKAMKKITGKGASSLAEGASVYAPSVDEIALYGLDKTGTVERHIYDLTLLEEEKGRGFVSTLLKPSRNFGDKSDFGLQSEINTDAIDESSAYRAMMVDKIETLVRKRLFNAHPDDKAHYKSIILIINSLKNK